MAKDSPHYMAKMAFNLKDHRRSHPIESMMSQHNKHNHYIEDAPDLTFNDNIELEDFLLLPSNSQVKYNIDLNQFNNVTTMRLPYVFEGPNLKRYAASEGVK